MAYTLPTVEDFRNKFPEFDEDYHTDDQIQDALDEAARNVDETWLEADYANAILYLAAHGIAVTDFGAESLGQDNLKSISIGPLSLSYGRTIAEAIAGDPSALKTTVYGMRFFRLRKLNIPAVKII